MPQPPLERFEDDARLTGDVRLFRRLSPDWVDVDADQPLGLRVRSVAFQMQRRETASEKGYPDRCMSLALASIVEDHAAGLDALLADGLAAYGVAELKASDLRAVGYKLQLVPETTEPWHVAAFGLSNNQEKKAKEKLAKAAQVVRAPR